MKKHNDKILMIALIIVTLILIGAMYFWAPVCEGLLELKNGNMVHMKCFYTAQVATVLTILLLILAITTLITKKVNSILTIAIGILLIAITYQSLIGIGICVKETMPCHVTAIWLRGSGALVTIIGIISCFIKREGE